jgi:hypothetical protein
MKKGFLIAGSFLLSTLMFAQSEKYMNAMQPKVAALDTTRDVNTLGDLANAFERIGDAEKNQWLPYYYAALAHVNSGLMIATQNSNAGGVAEKTDPVADKAEGLINKAEALSKDNSEIWIVKKQIATLRMMVDPMNRYMTFGMAANQALATAKQLNPDNPRVYLLQAQDKFYTPEQYGGSKTEAKEIFQEALKKFESYKPESAIHPHWGKEQANYFLSQIK